MALLIVPFAFIAPGCAEERLDSLGIDYDVDSGDDTVFIEHLWEVCYQEPDAGAQARYVTLTVEHDCDDDD